MQQITSFQKACAYLENDRFIRPVEYQSSKEMKENSPLRRMEYFLSLLGNPQEKFPTIVVSGTSGKGSTTTMIASMLTKAGYKTGITISPHLETVRERMQINGTLIQEKDFIDILSEIVPVIEMVGKSKFNAPSYFEILLAMTFIYFMKKKIDIGVIEVGLEGKFDGTNILKPLIFVLTNISLDHTAILGNTILKIAKEATERINNLAQISYKKPIVVFGVKQQSIVRLVKDICSKTNTDISQIRKDFGYTIQKEKNNETVFSFKSFTTKNFYSNITLHMIGNYQIENASLAIEAILQLQRFGFTIFEKTIRETLRHLYIPGRFEVKKHMPLIILDGAHNPAKMKAFLASCVKRYKKNKKIFIISITKGHNTSNMLRQISKVADIIIFCQYHIATDMGRKRAEEAIRLKKEYDSILNKKTKQFFLIKNSKESVRKALKKAKENDIIVITGSLYLVGEIRGQLHSLLL